MSFSSCSLYIVLFLHQTTTRNSSFSFLLSLYIVLFLHQTTTLLIHKLVPVVLYIVLFLHQTTTIGLPVLWICSCISYYSYIKPQPAIGQRIILLGCISYYSYIKPQLFFFLDKRGFVVYRTIPTSNHNYHFTDHVCRLVVYRTIPTSNHNPADSLQVVLVLYIVLFLHQTTTATQRFPPNSLLYIVLFLHQTTTYNVDIADNQHITITFINKK